MLQLLIILDPEVPVPIIPQWRRNSRSPVGMFPLHASSVLFAEGLPLFRRQGTNARIIHLLC